MRLSIVCVIALSALGILSPAFADEGEPGADAAPAETSPAVGLDKLLRLPNSYEADVNRRGGATASDWRVRFSEAHKRVDDAKKRLVALEEELQQVSETSSGWAVSAPGASDPQASPLSLRLRQDIRDQRTEIEDSQRGLRELEVEADLAAVPADWRE